MKNPKAFRFDKARRILPKEVDVFKKAIEEKTGKARPNRGRPPKNPDAKYEPVSIRIHPQALAWAKREAKKCGVGYQTVINNILLKKIA